MDPLARARAERLLAELCRTHVPSRARDQIRLEVAWRGTAATLVERRPPWDGCGDWTSQPIARFRYEPADGTWRTYWQRANGRWLEVEELHGTDLAAILRAVGRDRSGIFWG